MTNSVRLVTTYRTLVITRLNKMNLCRPMLFSVLSGYKMISVKGAVKKSEEVEKIRIFMQFGNICYGIWFV